MTKHIPKYKDTIPFIDKLYRFIWRVFALFLFKPFSLPFFNIYRVFVLKLFGAQLSWSCRIYASAEILSPKQLSMGKYSTLGPGVKLHLGKTYIGQKVTVSQRTYLCSATHDYKSINTPLQIGFIHIEDFVWIAAESFIMNNLTIKEGAVIGARSAVFKDVDAWTIVGGNPAQLIKKREVIDLPC